MKKLRLSSSQLVLRHTLGRRLKGNQRRLEANHRQLEGHLRRSKGNGRRLEVDRFVPRKWKKLCPLNSAWPKPPHLSCISELVPDVEHQVANLRAGCRTGHNVLL